MFKEENGDADWSPTSPPYVPGVGSALPPQGTSGTVMPELLCGEILGQLIEFGQALTSATPAKGAIDSPVTLGVTNRSKIHTKVWSASIA